MHSQTPEAHAERIRMAQKGAARSAKSKVPAEPRDLLDTRERVIAYLSRYKSSPKYGPAAARIAVAALQAIHTPEMKALEAENERLRKIIERHIPAAKPLLNELRIVK